MHLSYHDERYYAAGCATGVPALDKLLLRYAKQASRKNIHMECEVGVPPPVLNGIRREMRRVLQTLLRGATSYCVQMPNPREGWFYVNISEVAGAIQIACGISRNKQEEGTQTLRKMLAKLGGMARVEPEEQDDSIMITVYMGGKR